MWHRYHVTTITNKQFSRHVGVGILLISLLLMGLPSDGDNVIVMLRTCLWYLAKYKVENLYKSFFAIINMAMKIFIQFVWKQLFYLDVSVVISALDFFFFYEFCGAELALWDVTWRQANNSTYDNFLAPGALQTPVRSEWKCKTFLFEKMYFKISSAKWRPICWMCRFI